MFVASQHGDASAQAEQLSASPTKLPTIKISAHSLGKMWKIPSSLSGAGTEHRMASSACSTKRHIVPPVLLDMPGLSIQGTEMIERKACIEMSSLDHSQPLGFPIFQN